MISVEEYIRLKKKCPDPSLTSSYHTHYDEEQADFDAIVEFNRELVSKYHWLLPRNVFSGEPFDDYDYSYTELDCLPDGWYLKFGLDICADIQAALVAAQAENPNGGYEESAITTNCDSDKIIPYEGGYRILQIKEKFGTLRWYDAGAPKGVHEVITKYEHLSEEICIGCGAPAKWESKGWVSFFCDGCATEMSLDRNMPVENLFLHMD